MAYLKAYIAACEAYGWQGGGEFKTRLVEMANGRERRNADWDQPRHRYTLPFQNIDGAAYANIKQMHLVCRGMLNNFLYSDPLDNSATNDLVGVGDGVTERFQLSKLSVVDGVTYQREVRALYRPIGNGAAEESPITVTVNGSPATPTIYPDTGEIEFSSPPALNAVIRWSGEFSLWVRFNQDWLPFSIDSRNANGFIHNGTVELIEVPPEPSDAS